MIEKVAIPYKWPVDGLTVQVPAGLSGDCGRKVVFPDKWFETAFNEFLQAWEREIGMRPKGAAKAAQPHLRDANT